jgi:hypothetical protein
VALDEVKKFLVKKSLLKGPKTVKTYTERLGYFLDWWERPASSISINSQERRPFALRVIPPTAQDHQGHPV